MPGQSRPLLCPKSLNVLERYCEQRQIQLYFGYHALASVHSLNSGGDTYSGLNSE